MTIQQALGQVAGRSDLFLVRPKGVILFVTDRFAIRDVRNGHERNYSAIYSDLVTDDWEVLTVEQLRKRFPGAPAEAAA
jgi:hypothetical protein